MQTTYRLKASELNQKIIDGIKTLYRDQEIEIIICEVDETDYLYKSEANRNRLVQAINDVNQRKNLIEVSLEDLKDIYEPNYKFTTNKRCKVSASKLSYR